MSLAVGFNLLVLLSWCLTFQVRAAPSQSPLQLDHLAVTKPRKLNGRFLQITDLHPDPYYTSGASQVSACHRRKPKKAKKRASYYGTPFSECDSPLHLTNFTLDFLDKKWASEIDFVIWTGDNARHDNDRKLPRTPAEIYDLNRAVARKMENIFSSRGIPAIPSLGNNDVWPHNIMEAGPNSITNTFSSIWKSFIPFPAYQVFQRGGYYYVEVIPNAVAVVSLNTMYFYDSNKAVGGCGYLDQDDPGNLEFDWLEVQLTMFRERNMQVWLSGHVPPSPGNYFPECFVRYVELALRFQDTILGHLFGHMNADHFAFLEEIDLHFTEPSSILGKKKDQLYKDLIEEYAAIPTKASAVNYDNYGVINVSPPVVPNPYLPTFRIFSYNISGYKPGMEAEFERKHKHRRGNRRSKDKVCNSAPYKYSWKCHLSEPWYSDEESPSRSNRLWTPLGYAQYYLPHLERANKTKVPKFKLEYLTYPLSKLHPPTDAAGNGAKEAFHYPVPLRHLPRSLRNGTMKESKLAPYQMSDLTVPSWIKLAQRLGGAKEAKLRKVFRKYMYFGG